MNTDEVFSLFVNFNIKTACNRQCSFFAHHKTFTTWGLKPQLLFFRIYDWRTTRKLNNLRVLIFTSQVSLYTTFFDRINNSSKTLSHFVISACACIWWEKESRWIFFWFFGKGLKPLWSSINFLDPILELIA